MPLRSMDDSYETVNGEIIDKRPNFFKKQTGNWANMTLKNWRIHHSFEENFAENGALSIEGWQSSDNLRSLTIKGEISKNL